MGHVVDDDGLAAGADLAADGGGDVSSPPGLRPKLMSSRTAQATQRSSVTRATAAKPMPVVRQTTSRMVGTASMRATAATSSSRLSWSKAACPGGWSFGEQGMGAGAARHPCGGVAGMLAPQCRPSVRARGAYEGREPHSLVLSEAVAPSRRWRDWMRKLIVAAVACVAVGVSGAAFARGGGGGGGGGGGSHGGGGGSHAAAAGGGSQGGGEVVIRGANRSDRAGAAGRRAIAAAGRTSPSARRAGSRASRSTGRPSSAPRRGRAGRRAGWRR